MQHSFITNNEAETLALGKCLAKNVRGGDVLLLEGDLGAGKTHFSKGVAQGLGVLPELTSPTFNLVLEYELSHKEAAEHAARILRHFDLFRLENAEQLYDLDYFALIEDDEAVSLVEWGSKFSRALPVDYLLVHLKTEGMPCNQRKFEVSAHGPRSEKILKRHASYKDSALRRSANPSQASLDL